MTSGLTSVATTETLADLLEQLGGIAPERVRFRPPPGIATEKDVLEVEAHEDRLCELGMACWWRKPWDGVHRFWPVF